MRRSDAGGTSGVSTPLRSRDEGLYERDFYAWTRRQARELRRLARTRPNLPLDLRHIAEEIEDLGREQRHALRSWTARIVEHLLLLQHSPSREPRRGWIAEIVAFRREIARRLTPTLRRDLARQLPKVYAEARADLARKLERFGEDDLLAAIPVECPFTLDQVLGDWWPAEPEAGHGH
jgi:hypothetical protein